QSLAEGEGPIAVIALFILSDSPKCVGKDAIGSTNYHLWREGVGDAESRLVAAVIRSDPSAPDVGRGARNRILDVPEHLACLPHERGASQAINHGGGIIPSQSGVER